MSTPESEPRRRTIPTGWRPARRGSSTASGSSTVPRTWPAPSPHSCWPRRGRRHQGGASAGRPHPQLTGLSHLEPLEAQRGPRSGDRGRPDAAARPPRRRRRPHPHLRTDAAAAQRGLSDDELAARHPRLITSAVLGWPAGHPSADGPERRPARQRPARPVRRAAGVARGAGLPPLPLRELVCRLPERHRDPGPAHPT